MIWWAYAGLSASVITSILLVVTLLGMPAQAIAPLAIETTAVLLAVAIVANTVANVFQPQRPRSRDTGRRPVSHA